MTWKRKLMALLLGAVSILGVACNGGGDAAEETTEETTNQETPAEEEATP